jgi:hypothetical protein
LAGTGSELRKPDEGTPGVERIKRIQMLKKVHLCNHFLPAALIQESKTKIYER